MILHRLIRFCKGGKLLYYIGIVPSFQRRITDYCKGQLLGRMSQRGRKQINYLVCLLVGYSFKATYDVCVHQDETNESITPIVAKITRNVLFCRYHYFQLSDMMQIAIQFLSIFVIQILTCRIDIELDKNIKS